MKKILKIGLLVGTLALSVAPVFASESTAEKVEQSQNQGEVVVGGLERLNTRSHQYKVTATSLIVRSGAGLKYGQVGSLYKGDIVWGYGTEEDNDYVWLYVWNDNVSGWVAIDYVENIS